MIYTSSGNFFLSAEQLADSPSRKDGIDEGTERELRHYCCDVVAEATVLLRLPQVVAVTAQLLVQRFYCKRSLKKFDVKEVAVAAFWLACKLEEVIEIDNPNRLTLRSVIVVFDRVIRRRDGRSLTIMDPNSQRYEEMKQMAVRTERHMLRAFGFILHMEHSHRFVLNYCQMLQCGRELQQEAWNMANDSLRTTLCVRYRAEILACGILFTAARKLKVPMPENPPWWQLFEVKEEELYDVCATLCSLYAQPKAQHVALGMPPPGAGVAASLPAGARSPLASTPLRSPASAAPSTGGSLAALPAASAEPPRSTGQAPSEVQEVAAGDRTAGAAADEPSAAANGSAPASDGRQGQQSVGEPQPSGSRSPSRSRSHKRGRSGSRSRSRDRAKKRGRSRSKSRERRRSRSRDTHRDRDSHRDRDRGSGKRDRRDDVPLYRPPRRDERRREGTHRPGAQVAAHALAAAASAS